MQREPRTIIELKSWLKSRGEDPKKFAVDWHPEWYGYVVRAGPPYWTLNLMDWPAETTVVRCDTEAELCECYVELVHDRHHEPTSLTTRLRKQVRDRIERSWQVEE